MHKRIPNVFFILFLCFSAFNAYAELITSEKYGYTIDFPEGFAMEDGTDDETMFLFTHTMMPLHAIIRVYPSKICETAKDAFSLTFSKLNASFECDEVLWRNQKCAIANFTMAPAMMQSVQSGQAVAIPLAKYKSVLVLLAYAPKDLSFDLGQIIASIIDSVMIDTGSFKESGPLTAYAFPSSGKKDVTLTVAGRKITSQMDKSDKEASQFIIDREFAVFRIYAANNSPLMFDAWQRFYRIIAKDALGRFKKLSFDLYSALFSEASRRDESNPNAALAQMLLNWVQYFDYAQVSSTPDKADFVNLPAVIDGASSDCDSRSMLLAVLLKNMGMDTCLLVSPYYRHAMLGICLDGKLGQAFEIDGKKYLFGETTGKDMTFGLIFADFPDKTKWLPVEFPF